MASRKRQSEGIALLSMYNDEEDDDELDAPASSSSTEDPNNDDANQQMDEDENPNIEDGEIRSGRVVAVGAEFQVVDGSLHGLTATPQIAECPEHSQQDTMSNVANESELIELQETPDMSKEETRQVDLSDNFLPPPPKTKCPVELQEKINKFLYLKKVGRSFNTEVRNRKDYRNPDFLLHAVRYQDIDQIGSCFSKDVFDPHGYDPSDFYDEIEADMRREMERKDQERKKSQKVDFVSGGNHPSLVGSAPKINVPLPGVAASGMNPVPSADVSRDGRPNKKSKWDKVDSGPANSLAPGIQDSSSKIGAHAALLSAANARAGYMAFAQQKRREAEDKRSMEKKLERRS